MRRGNSSDDHTPVMHFSSERQNEFVGRNDYLPEPYICMPLNEIPKFHEYPLDYWKFNRSLINDVEKYVTGAVIRLLYFINYCEGEARGSY
ncbi:hypothetical protein FGIG_06885 [Fasciola gigantica]|uniref:Uncharacterized protein n=1 Tax=Fasciola gigantica TaxID=46835 RepID=A0A504YAA5_FASGI|nr:hypothetical protein FGIG_06885 [Fasciola gigantica]